MGVHGSEESRFVTGSCYLIEKVRGIEIGDLLEMEWRN